MSSIIIRASATILPNRIISNASITDQIVAGSEGNASADEIEKARSRGNEIERKTGIVERRFFGSDEDPVEVGYSLLLRLLSDAKIGIADLDGIIVSSSSIHGFPGLAQQVVAFARTQRHEFGNPFVLDLGGNACTSFMYGLGLAHALLNGPQYRVVACIAVEFSSRCLDYHVRSFGITTLFGDAASGLLVSAEGEGPASLESVRLSSRIDGEKITYIHGSGLEASDLRAPVPANSRWFMSGPPVAIDAIEIIVSEVQAYRNEGIAVDWLAPHQGNLTRILEPACEKLGLAHERLLTSFPRTGNTSSASIPIVLSELLQSNRAQRGDNVILVGFGASFSVGSGHVKLV